MWKVRTFTTSIFCQAFQLHYRGRRYFVLERLVWHHRLPSGWTVLVHHVLRCGIDEWYLSLFFPGGDHISLWLWAPLGFGSRVTLAPWSAPRTEPPSTSRVAPLRQLLSINMMWALNLHSHFITSNTHHTGNRLNDRAYQRCVCHWAGDHILRAHVARNVDSCRRILRVPHALGGFCLVLFGET